MPVLKKLFLEHFRRGDGRRLGPAAFDGPIGLARERDFLHHVGVILLISRLLGTTAASSAVTFELASGRRMCSLVRMSEFKHESAKYGIIDLNTLVGVQSALQVLGFDPGSPTASTVPAFKGHREGVPGGVIHRRRRHRRPGDPRAAPGRGQRRFRAQRGRLGRGEPEQQLSALRRPTRRSERPIPGARYRDWNRPFSWAARAKKPCHTA